MQCQIINKLSDLDVERYQREGVAILKDYLTGDPYFTHYLNDLTWAAHSLLQQYGKSCPPSLAQSLLDLHHTNSKEVQNICHLNTLPAKLISGGALKYSERMVAIARHIYGKEAVLGSPAGSDTLHIFAADPLFDKFILPVHQDYPHFLFSQHALTLWIPMVPYTDNVGGINAWLGSHNAGIRKTTTSPLGHFEPVMSETELAEYPVATVPWDLGDVVIFDIHLLHQGIANRNASSMRVTQLFRYANLNAPDAIAERWRSAVFARKAPVFQEMHAEFYVKPVDYTPKNLFNPSY